ncbi:MAG: ABC transporter ATP-binding protein [Chloroflexota bacterium]|nr:MAG: ABC transporter ATP-binding protein [Chloroflexota bacterium]
MEPIITTQGLTKVYGAEPNAVHAITDLSLQIMPGELFGLFGPNGAGKSTLVRMLTTLLAPTRGVATVRGFDIIRDELQVRASCGLVTADERSFYGRLSATQNLSFFAAMQNMTRHEILKRVAYVLDLFGLTAKANTRFQALSTGQRQRLNMARALVHDPPILFLDEPTKSMDVQTSDFVKALIKQELVGRQGKTVVYISHELYEMDNFCDRVVILADGRAQVVGTPAELGASLPRRALYRIVVQGDIDSIAREWRQIASVESVTLVSEGLATAAYDVALADEAAWLSVMEAVHNNDGRVETYRRVDDQSLRRIVAHFSDGAMEGADDTLFQRLKDEDR